MSLLVKLKIGLVIDDSLDSNDGVQQYVKTLGAWLSLEGHEVRYLTGQTKLGSWQGGRVYSLAKNVKVSFNANRLSIPLPANRRQIRRILSKEKFDILHVQMPFNPLLAQRIIKAASPNVAVIGTFHILPVGRLQELGSRLLSIWYGNTIKRFDKIFAVSRAAQDFAKTVFGFSAEVLPNVVDYRRYHQAVKSTPEQRSRIVFLGRLVKRKGAAELIKAFAVLLDGQWSEKPELIIAGDGHQRPSLEKLARDLGIEKHVKFLGFIDEKAKPELLNSAQIAVFPSLYGESFGIVLIEAMAAKAGVVLGGNNPGYACVLGDRPECLIDPRKTTDFAAKMRQLLIDSKSANDIHNWQQQTVTQYAVEEVGQKIVAEYHQAIAKRRPKPNNTCHEGKN